MVSQSGLYVTGVSTVNYSDKASSIESNFILVLKKKKGTTSRAYHALMEQMLNKY